jgi:hypothetical protein
MRFIDNVRCAWQALNAPGAWLLDADVPNGRFEALFQPGILSNRNAILRLTFTEILAILIEPLNSALVAGRHYRRCIRLQRDSGRETAFGESGETKRGVSN